MNQRPVGVANQDDDERMQGIPGLDLEHLLAMARRQWRVVAASVFGIIILGACYALTAVPLFTASTSVFIDGSNSKVLDQLSLGGGYLDDEASVLSQIELLKSNGIAGRVVDNLKLQENPEFMQQSESPVSVAVSTIRSLLNPKHWLGTEEAKLLDASARKRQEAIERVMLNVNVSRVGRAYVIQIDYTSTSPQLAASVVTALADAYLTDKLDAKYDATRRAGDWLQDRIEELRKRSLESDLAVQKFRAANGLLVANDKLVSDQQLTELNSALIIARADTARAQARYDRIQSIIAGGQTEGIVTDALESSVIRTMREKYLDASKRESEIRTRLGPQHIQAVRLRQEMAEYNRLMFEELRPIAESYESELRVAQSREQQIMSGVANATNVSVNASETQVQLRELERTADTYRNLYQTFMQRYQEAVQQQSFPITDARVISRAIPPEKASQPRVSLILALSAIMGFGLGAALAGFREFRDRFFRVAEQVRDVLGLEYIGGLPLIYSPQKTVTTALPVAGEVYKRSQVANFAIDNPLSSFSETLRSARVAMDFNIEKSPKIVGVVSVLPGEGKSTVAVNLAQTLARTSRTLLIDADLRNPGASRMLAQHADEGLLEVILDNRSPSSLLLTDLDSGLNFLPAVVKRRVPHSSELLASPQMQQLLSNVSADYDYIVLDLPPLGPVVDARAMAGRIDTFVMVVEWGKTSRRVVKDILISEPHIFKKCLGVILNKVDNDKMKLYRDYGSSEYYKSRYTSYYQDNVS